MSVLWPVYRYNVCVKIPKRGEDTDIMTDQMIADLDILLSYADIRKEVLWVEANYSGGGALHLPIEGDFENSHIQYHIDNMESGDWAGYAEDVKEADKERFLKLAYDLLAMKEPYRELILLGSTVTEDVWDKIYD